jgi:hypothetical protein
MATPDQTATPVELGENLLTLLRRADTHPDPRISGGGDSVADHLHAALIALMGSQGWGRAQATEAIATARLGDQTLGRAMLAHQEGRAHLAATTPA